MTDKETELTDSEIENIQEEARIAAEGLYWPCRIPTNPYKDSEKAEIWEFAFRNELASQNG